MLINYTHGLVKAQFEILTNEIYASVCGGIQIDPELTQLEYRILGDGMLSEFSPLTMELDWCYAMMRVCQAKKEGGGVEVNILKINKLVSIMIVYCSIYNRLGRGERGDVGSPSVPV